MIYAFFGNDTGAVRTKAFTFLRTLADDGADTRTVTADDWKDGLIRDLAGGTSLFGGTETVVLDTLSEAGEEVLEALLNDLDLLKESPNHFVLVEGPLTAPAKRQVEKFSERAVEVAGEKKVKFNTFLLADALQSRDRKSLWLFLNEAWREGVENEQIVGLLFWQVKALRLAEKTGSAEEAGLKPFVYQKAKRALGKFTDGDLDRLSRELITIYHDGHAGKKDMSLALEQWVLTV